uniref:Uncharacterized protein n=1 Tax=Oryza sativa subsp. japonica TaxID=39947 RepID=Q5VMI2_ORYSJ|nr:hypothetical protein [Oryza sativa Japonica Group]BAD69343.1 hypothetical protein [Oryza sativa Japonica Group]
MGGREGRGGEPAVAAASGLHLPAGSRKEGERKGDLGVRGASPPLPTPSLPSSDLRGREGDGEVRRGVEGEVRE